MKRLKRGRWHRAPALALLLGLVALGCDSVLGIEGFEIGCVEGEARCSGNAPERCDARGRWETLSECENQSCIEGVCVGECAPGQRQCYGKTPQHCEAGAWTAEDVCAEVCLEGACKACFPDKKGCIGNTPRACNEAGEWVEGVACVGQTCVAGHCAGDCAPGVRCLGDTPQSCNALGEWESKASCGVGEVCSGGSCTCISGDRRCYENRPETCAANQWQDEGEDCTVLGKTCDPELIVCSGECVQGARRCLDASTAETCDANGAWAGSTTCGLLGCFDGLCAACNPGDKSCADNAPQTCGQDKQWALDSACEEQTCLGGTCAGQCVFLAKRCAGKWPQGCDAVGAWQLSGSPCASGESCFKGACLASCAPGERRCAGDHPQICDDNGAWQSDGPACGACIRCAQDKGMCEPDAMDAAGCTEPVAVEAGRTHTCALLPSGKVKCWGNNYYGQLGLGKQGARGDQPGEMGKSLPAVDLGSDATVKAIGGRGDHTCALLEGGSIKCWGYNNNGQLGLGDTNNRGDGPGEMGDTLPTVNLGSGVKATQISAGGDYTCALLEDGSVKCWGYNVYGQLGLGDPKNHGDAPDEMGDALPTVNLGSGVKATQISAGGSHTCALLEGGSVKCWGYNHFGQLGLGDVNNRGDGFGEMGETLPAVNLGSGMKATQISAGGSHTCALLSNGRVKCWGDNGYGQLGLGDTARRGAASFQMGDALPTVSLGLGMQAIAIHAGSMSTCALQSNGSIKCWGYNAEGRLGLGDTSHRGDAPNEMGDNLPAIDLGRGAKASAIRNGGSHTCALLVGGSVKCWGKNDSGQLGLFDTSNRGDGSNEMGDELPTADL